jgi:hypothetical protein
LHTMRIKLLTAVVLSALGALLLPLTSLTEPIQTVTGLTRAASTLALPAASAARTASAGRTRPTPPPPAPGTCTLSVPFEPLSAHGLATPWQLGGTGCHESDPNSAAFVQATVIDRATGQVSVYDPLVVDRDTRPAVAPVVPALPYRSVVAIWVGFNGSALRLVGPGRERCVDGVRGSIFGQNAFCNTDAFFDAAHAAMSGGQLVVPPLGTGKDGRPCPTSRDFSIVDQDQSDNTTTQYLVDADGRLAQDTPQNRARLTGAQTRFNGSDERLVAIAVDHALGCTPWTAPDLADTTHAQRLTALPLNEMLAGARQMPPVALVPALDPFVQIDGQPSLEKLNAFRTGVDQPRVASLAAASTPAYCGNLYHVGLPRLAADRSLTSAAPSPFPDQANSLFTFLAMRFMATFSDDDGFLQCVRSLGLKSNPVSVTTQDGIVVDATLTLPPAR